MIRVVVVDDHAMVRLGLEQLLGAAEGIEVDGTAGDGGAALAVVIENRPDVVLMDLQMPEVDGVAATRRIVAADSAVQVVVLTSFSDSGRIVAALDAGAVGYLLKDAEPEDLLEGIRAAARGSHRFTLGQLVSCSPPGLPHAVPTWTSRRGRPRCCHWFEGAWLTSRLPADLASVSGP